MPRGVQQTTGGGRMTVPTTPPTRLIQTEEDVTPFVQGLLSRTPDPRLREVLLSAVAHLHAFIREVRPTEPEFELAIRWLRDVGQACTDSHNEMVLAADTLGASTLVDLINNDGMQGETMSALLGPFYRGEAPDCGPGDTIARSDTPGDDLVIEGRVLDVDGTPIAGAVLDVWQASPDGLYENQDPDQADFNLRGKFCTDADGYYCIRTVRPAGYPIPVFGPVGKLVLMQDRPILRPAHVHFIVSAPGHKTLITQIFADSMQAMLEDVVYGAKDQIAAELQQANAPHPVAKGLKIPHFVCRYDFRLKPGEPTFPEPPIAGKAEVSA
jgi:catechol 1,2-dioxygenase